VFLPIQRPDRIFRIILNHQILSIKFIKSIPFSTKTYCFNSVHKVAKVLFRHLKYIKPKTARGALFTGLSIPMGTSATVKKHLLYSMHKPFFGLSCKNNQILLISLPGFSVFSGFSKHFSESNLLPIFPHTYSERLTGKVETTGIDKLDQS
jgi:hypothetical protein